LTVILETQGLTKRFGRQTAVNAVDLSVRKGEVYGFLGPNGAGKSTTIRMLLRLIRPSAGQARLFGQDVTRHPEALRRVGSLVDGGAFYPFLSGRENLALLSRLQGSDPKRIDPLIDEVGLGDTGRKKVRGYSTGMRQRLGVAAALLNDPELVILDEPANGLDVAGISEMRNLIRRISRDQGRTVFLSSHLLHEVEQVCDRVAIVAKGAVLREAVMGDLLREEGALRIEAQPADKAVAALSGRWPVHASGDTLLVTAAGHETPAVVAALVGAGVEVFHVSAPQRTLEQAFISITQEPA
jgi:ABC-2 type transport system ATP-binding protein